MIIVSSSSRDRLSKCFTGTIAVLHSLAGLNHFPFVRLFDECGGNGYSSHVDSIVTLLVTNDRFGHECWKMLMQSLTEISLRKHGRICFQSFSRVCFYLPRPLVFYFNLFYGAATCSLRNSPRSVTRVYLVTLPRCISFESSSTSTERFRTVQFAELNRLAEAAKEIDISGDVIPAISDSSLN